MAKTYSYKCKTCGVNGHTHSYAQRYCYGCSYDRNVLKIIKPDRWDSNGKLIDPKDLGI